MKVLLLCGCCEPQHEPEAVSQAKGLMEAASNLHQRRLIEGLRSRKCHLQVVSAPFIGAWPVRSGCFVFRGFRLPSQQQITYVPFHNLWGWRSISRAHALHKPVEQFLKETQGAKQAIIVYAPHTPFLYAAVRAKQKAPDLHICLIVPDLPQYMNLNAKCRCFYDFCKHFDIRLFEKLNRQVDSYMLLTRPMADALAIGNRPFMVAEGLAENKVIRMPAVRSKTFVYAGKLIRRFGIQRLLDAFSMLKDDEYRLIVCGDGEMRCAVENAVRLDPRICYKGLLPHDQLAEVLQSAGVLVNPRTGKEAYTRYSFPSKIIEYLQTGLPVVSAVLEGMPDVYRQLLYCPQDDSTAALAKAMEDAMLADPAREQLRIQAACKHLQTLAPSAAAGRLMAMIEGKAVDEEC